MTYSLKPISPQRGDCLLVVVCAVAIAIMFSGPITSLFSKEIEPEPEVEPQVELEVLGPVDTRCEQLNTVCPGEEEPDVKERIVEQAKLYGVDPDEALWLADCESDLNPMARNSVSSAKGLYQFTDQTWAYIGAPSHQYDAEQNIKMFMEVYPLHKSWWACSFPY